MKMRMKRKIGQVGVVKLMLEEANSLSWVEALDG